MKKYLTIIISKDTEDYIVKKIFFTIAPRMGDLNGKC